jgi:ubiquinol-cytochrome c reductase cytochrome b/c1 subunit
MLLFALSPTGPHALSFPVTHRLSRLRLKSLLLLHASVAGLTLSASLPRSYTLGASLAFTFSLQLLSGVALSFSYVASPSFVPAFFSSVDSPHHSVLSVLRQHHIFSTSTAFLLLYSHIFKSLVHCVASQISHASFSTGTVISLLLIVVAFLGYVLPLSQMSFWGLTVFSNILTTLPYVGLALCHWLWSGEFVTLASLTRVHSLHVFLPFVFAGLVVLHFLALHLLLSSDSSHDRFSTPTESSIFHSFHLARDLTSVVALHFVHTVLLLAQYHHLFHEESFQPSDPSRTSDKILPEWFFLAYFAVLKSIPHKQAGTLAVGLFLVSLSLLPSSHQALSAVHRTLVFVSSSASSSLHHLIVLSLLSCHVLIVYPTFLHLQFALLLLAFSFTSSVLKPPVGSSCHGGQGKGKA